jgi:type IV pilus assembly protein PilX
MRFTIIRNQNGAVLITGMVLLVLLTILGLVAMQGATLQERMAGNLEQQDIAFQAAEAALREAEAWIGIQVAGATLPAFDDTDGLYQMPSAGDPPHWKTVDWTNDSSYRDYAGGGLDTPPKYIIEFVALVANPDSQSLAVDDMPDNFGMYRISSRAVSPNSRAEVLLQTTYLR